MSIGFTRTEITGNVGNEPELRSTKNGTPVLNFSVAVNDSYKDGEGNKKEKTTWFKVSVYGKRGEGLLKYVKKGMGVTCVGEVGAEAWISDGGDAKSQLTLTLGDSRKDFRFISGGKSEEEIPDISELDDDQLFSGNE